MIAVKEAIGTPDRIYATMQIVDTIVPYVWMGMLVSCVGLQAVYDRWNRSDVKILHKLRTTQVTQSTHVALRFLPVLLIAGLGALASWLSQSAAGFLPVIKDVMSTTTWVIVIVSSVALGLSFTPIKKLENFGSTRVGYFVLYLVLASMGAKASLTNIGATLLVILAGFLMVLVHAAVMILAARLIRAPMFLVAVASQANIGGVASAPIVAEIYQPGFASVGLLLAILGNIVGTYIGILTAQICRFLAGG